MKRRVLPIYGKSYFRIDGVCCHHNYAKKYL